MIPRDRSESRKGISIGGNACVVCGWHELDHAGRSLVEGAHARPFGNTIDYDKSDNIFGLCPNHHSEYDAGNFTIDPIAQQCIHADSKNLLHHKHLVGSVGHIQLGYFDYHRVHIFRKREP